MLEVSISLILAGAATAALAVICRSLGEGLTHAQRITAEIDFSLGEGAL